MRKGKKVRQRPVGGTVSSKGGTVERRRRKGTGLEKALSIRGREADFPSFAEVYRRADPNFEKQRPLRSLSWRSSLGLGAAAASVLIAVLLILRVGRSEGMPASALVVSATGNIVLRTERGTPANARAGALVRKGERLEVERGGAVDVLVAPDRAFRLLGPARLEMVSFEKDAKSVATRFKLVQGELWSSLGRLSPSDRYEIETPLGVVRVVGTEFRVSVQNGATDVSVIRGAVRLDPPAGEAAVVRHGQGLSVKQDGSMGRVRKVGYSRSARAALGALRSLRRDAQLASLLNQENSSLVPPAKREAAADVVELGSGERVVGQLLLQDASRVVVRTDRGLRILRKQDVRAVRLAP